MLIVCCLYASEVCMSILINVCTYARTSDCAASICMLNTSRMLSFQGKLVHHLRLQSIPQSLRMVHAATPQSTHVAHTSMQHALLGVPVSITACMITHIHTYVCICVGVDRCMPCVQHASSDCMVIRMYIRVCMCVSMYVSDHISLCDQEPYQMNVPHHQQSSASTLPYTSSSHSLTHKGEASHRL